MRVSKVPYVPVEGVIIFGVAAWETVALFVNFIVGKKVVHPVTDALRWSARHRYGRFGWWLLLGWLVNHVYEEAVEDAVCEETSSP